MLVRRGISVRLAAVEGGNTFQRVYTEMMLHVARDYSGVGDVRALTTSEILFFYDGLRGELKEYSKPRK